MYKKAVIPLDMSQLAECALNHAVALLKEGTIGELTLVNVIEVPENQALEGVEPLVQQQRDFKTGAVYLSHVQSDLKSKGIQANIQSLAGDPATAIIDYCRANNVDLIVIATHGYTGLKKLILGSVALKVLQDANIPVLLIRAESCQP